MNAPARQQGLDTALDEAFDLSLPEAAFADHLGRLAAALTGADGAVVIDEAGDTLFQFGAGADTLVDLCRKARLSDEGQARSDRRLALTLPAGSSRLALAILMPTGGRAMALAWERLLFLAKLAATRRDAATGPFEPGLLKDASDLARGDWRAAQPFVDKLRRLAGADDVTLGLLEGDAVEKVAIANQPGLIAAAPAQDDARARLVNAVERGDVLGHGQLRYAIDMRGQSPAVLIDGVKAIFALPKARQRRGWLRKLRAPAIFCTVVGVIAFIPVPDYAELPATVIASHQREMIAPVTAVLTDLTVEEGDLVTEGDIIATFDDADLQLEASGERAHLAATLTKIQTSRRERDVASQKDLELEAAQIEARIARIDAELAYYQLPAPISGVVVSDPAKDLIGARLPVGETLLRISSTNDLTLEAWVSDIDRVRVNAGATGEFSPDAAPENMAITTVQRISPAAEDREGFTSFRVRADLQSVDGLREGMAGVLALDQRRVFIWRLVWERLSNWVTRTAWL